MSGSLVFRAVYQTRTPVLGAAWRTGGVLRVVTSCGFWIERVDGRWCLDESGALARREGDVWEEVAAFATRHPFVG